MGIISNNLQRKGQRAFWFLTCEWKFSSLSSFPPETQGETASSHTSVHTWGTFSHKAKQPPPPRCCQVRQFVCLFVFSKKQWSWVNAKTELHLKATLSNATWCGLIKYIDFVKIPCQCATVFSFELQTSVSSQLSFRQLCFLFHPGLYRASWILCPDYFLHTCPGIWVPRGFLSASILFGLLMGGRSWVFGNLSSLKELSGGSFANGGVQTVQYLCSVYRHWVN